MGRAGQIGLVAAALMVSACAHAPRGPGEALAAFGAALARGDLRGAYAMTSADLQRRLPFEAFAAGFRGPAADPAALGQRIAAEATRVPPRVEVALQTGEPVPLVFEDGRWRVDGPVYEAWGQETPRAALRTFLRAIDARRYDVLLRLVPDRERGGLTAERLRSFWETVDAAAHRRLLVEVRGALAAPLVEAGDEAHLPLAGGGEVRLAREAGGWKIEELGAND
ncbi:MAG TPA: hypothetical protein VHM31_22565 [Polyangia bacterium]|nr:hypothetical protein [Polyangia bacterium]